METSNHHRMKAVFLDRDGTINVERHYVYRKEDFILMPGVLEALKILTHNRIPIFIATNQAGIARGFFTEADYHALTLHMLELFAKNSIIIQETAFCPHHPDASIPEYRQRCGCRKPGTKMLETLLSKWAIHPQEAVLVGDKNSDVDAGRSLGMKTYLVLTGHGRDHCASSRADHVVNDLKAAVEHMCGVQA